MFLTIGTRNVSNYQQDGTASEPLDVNSLQTLALENKLDSQQPLLDSVTGQTLPAGEMLIGQVTFPISAYYDSATAIAPLQVTPRPDSLMQILIARYVYLK